MVCGGKSEETDAVESCEIVCPKKTEVPSLTTERSGHGACNISGVLYAFEGQDGGLDPLNCIEKLRPGSEAPSWEKAGFMDEKRGSFGHCVLGDRIFVAGGILGEDLSTNTASSGSPGEKWGPVAPMGEKRAAPVAAALDGKMFVAGGYAVDEDTKRARVHSSVEAYDPEENKWTPIAPMNVARYASAAVIFNGRLHVIGGIDADDNVLRSVERYDADEDRWEIVNKMKLPCPVAFAAAVVA